MQLSLSFLAAESGLMSAGAMLACRNFHRYRKATAPADKTRLSRNTIYPASVALCALAEVILGLLLPNL